MEILYIQEVSMLGKNNNKNRGVKAPGVTPQGYGQDAEFAEEPKSKLENAAKKKNTK
jgi:small acid-soluble spore protein L (minor)